MPIRTCVGCRARREQAELIRIGITEDGTLVARERGSSGGRSAYVCRSARCVIEALKPGRIERTLKRPVTKAALVEFEKVLECKLR
jgi:predicted RNA-binding protein YlxR (DUF448 family)